MPLTDMPLAELRNYRPDVAEPGDFDAFWKRTLAESRAVGGTVERRTVDTPFTEIVVEDVTFPGFGGEPVKAWLTRPARTSDRPLPVVVEYLGYGGGRGLPGERALWAAAGYAHLLMDTRGQGSAWGSGGDTPDPHGAEPSVPGFMTRGIRNPDEYYYRRVFTDAVRLLDAVEELDGLDAGRVAVTGGSQGGGISLAAAALSDRVRALMPDVPFLCHFERAAELTPEAPFTEIARYLSVHRGSEDEVFTTLSYFDGANFARRIEVPALFSVALMDDIVLPSTVFTAYNRLRSTDHEIEVYRFNGHEGGQTHHWMRQAEWLPSRLS